MSPTRSYSPKHEKSVVIGPVTDMVTKQERKQEYYRHRDAHQGKVRKTSKDVLKRALLDYALHNFGSTTVTRRASLLKF